MKETKKKENKILLPSLNSSLSLRTNQMMCHFAVTVASETLRVSPQKKILAREKRAYTDEGGNGRAKRNGRRVFSSSTHTHTHKTRISNKQKKKQQKK